MVDKSSYYFVSMIFIELENTIITESRFELIMYVSKSNTTTLDVTTSRRIF